jgi:hypothetical protein
VTELTADLFISLDGFACAVEVGPYFGYGGPELDEWIQTEIDKPQVIVFGRVTYALLAPMATNGADTASQRLARLGHAPLVVLTAPAPDVQTCWSGGSSWVSGHNRSDVDAGQMNRKSCPMLAPTPAPMTKRRGRGPS